MQKKSHTLVWWKRQAASQGQTDKKELTDTRCSLAWKYNKHNVLLNWNSWKLTNSNRQLKKAGELNSWNVLMNQDESTHLSKSVLYVLVKVTAKKKICKLKVNCNMSF